MFNALTYATYTLQQNSKNTRWWSLEVTHQDFLIDSRREQMAKNMSNSAVWCKIGRSQSIDQPVDKKTTLQSVEVWTEMEKDPG